MTLRIALLLALCLLLGCPTESSDDDSAAGDDDTAEADTPPVISDLVISVEIPDGETEEMLVFTFTFHDAEGDIQGGQIRLYAGDASPLGGEDMAGYMTLADEPDATDGSLLVYTNIGGDDGVPPGEAFAYGVTLADRAGNESNMLEDSFTVPQ